jgi:serine/threonine-protein kinase
MAAEPRPDAAPDPLVGSVIDGYRVVALLGRGGMGDVYRAFDPRRERMVAVKLVSASRASDPSFLARFEREARAASAISHPHLAQVHATGVFERRPFYVMEYVEGRTLSRVLDDEGPLAPAIALDYLRQAAEGLAAAHERGIVHRDLKPDNLMVDAEGRLKIVDFGLARPMAAGSTITHADRVMGTPQYMAPEQASAGIADFRTDMYALGATFYHLLAGVPPFVADSSVGVMLKHVNDPLVPLGERAPRVPRALAALIGRMLEKEPAARYADWAAVLAALDDVRRSAASDPAVDEATRAVRIVPAVPRRRASSLEPSRGLPAWVLLLAAVAVAAAAALTVVSKRPSPLVPRAPRPHAPAPRTV